MDIFRKHRATIIAGGLVATLIVALAAASLTTRADGTGVVAIVHAGDGGTRELPLDQDATVTITTELGTNVIEVEHGAVHMADADCPNGNCLREHAISSPGEQIVCLPHRLWIEVATGHGDATSSMDVDAVTWDDDNDDGDATVDLIAR